MERRLTTGCHIFCGMLKCREQGSQHDQRIMLLSSDHTSNLNRGVLVDNSYEHLFFSTITIIPYKSRRRIRTGIATHPATQPKWLSIIINSTHKCNKPVHFAEHTTFRVNVCAGNNSVLAVFVFINNTHIVCTLQPARNCASRSQRFVSYRRDWGIIVILWNFLYFFLHRFCVPRETRFLSFNIHKLNSQIYSTENDTFFSIKKKYLYKVRFAAESQHDFASCYRKFV